jgi:putative hydrolase of the HAD superfamily
MKKTPAITTLFVDIGGVLLTNGWDSSSHKQAAQLFDLNLSEMEDRHHLTFDTYEMGKISLQEYLQRVLFYEKRSFTEQQFSAFMFEQSQPFCEMIDLIGQLKALYGLKIVVVSNEGRELNAYRIQKFKLASFVDCFVSSCFVHLRKPDADIYRLALDIAQVRAHEVLYIEDRLLFVQTAEQLGIQGLHHTNYLSTKAKLEAIFSKICHCMKSIK